MGWMYYGNGYVKSSIRIAKLVRSSIIMRPRLHRKASFTRCWHAVIRPRRAAQKKSETVRWVVRFYI